MITVEEHLATVLDALTPLPAVRLPLDRAHGCGLAEDVVARLPVPPFDNSAMDGYAVRAEDVAGATTEHPVRLPVRADLPAGTGDRPQVTAGTAVRIMTGAPLPPGADAVVPVEGTDQPAGAAALPETVAVGRAVAAGSHVRRAGEDVAPGQTLLAAGTRLGAVHLSAVASVGHGSVLAHPRPRVGVLSTGDELVPAGRTPRHGQIPDSNSHLLAALAREAGAEVVALGSVGDEPGALTELLEQRLADVDVVVTSGGVSAGAYDVVKEALTPLGTVGFTQVAMQPGKPQAFGILAGRVPIFGLPGNPVSVLVSFHVFVRPALRALQDLPTAEPDRQAVAEVGWSCPPGRRQYIPVLVRERRDGPPAVRPAAAGGSGSHLVASLARAQALAVVAADVPAVTAGDTVGLTAMMGR